MFYLTLRRRKRIFTRLATGLSALLVYITLAGCATTAPSPGTVYDPLESANRAVFAFNDKVDRYALKPLAKGYRKITPSFARIGINNFFGNLDDVTIAASSALQGKFQQSLSDSARVVVNTIFGLGGFIDVASQLDLKKHHDDFGHTLGAWGWQKVHS